MAQIKAILAEQSKSGGAAKPYQTRIAFSSSWQGNDPYMQEVTVEDATENSRVDLHPNATTLTQLAEDGVSALYVENNDGTFTANAVGGPPSTSMRMLATVTEVEPVPFKATLAITAPNGSTVTVEKDGTMVNTHTATGSAVNVIVNAAGTYDISATDGEDEDNKSVTVSADEEIIEVTLRWSLLNTDQLTLGQTGIYFKRYPNITWQVQHLDGNYAYLALYPMTETTRFDYYGSPIYAGSTIASKCTTFLNDTIPNVAQYLEDVTVNGVTAKVFIPSRDQLNSEWDWPKAGASNRICQNGYDDQYWTSTTASSEYAIHVTSRGNFSGGISSASSKGFRPAVKVQFQL